MAQEGRIVYANDTFCQISVYKSRSFGAAAALLADPAREKGRLPRELRGRMGGEEGLRRDTHTPQERPS